MTYLYKIQATITTELEVEANSATDAEELVQEFLYPSSHDSTVYVRSNEGIEITTIESDSEGNPFLWPPTRLELPPVANLQQ